MQLYVVLAIATSAIAFPHEKPDFDHKRISTVDATAYPTVEYPSTDSSENPSYGQNENGGDNQVYSLEASKYGAGKDRSYGDNIKPSTYKVVVGGPGILAYNPPIVEASPGDVIQFEFLEKNHTLTESSFQTPCIALPNGINSGFIPNLNNITPGPTYQLVVKDTTPQWFYCLQVGHCGAGMVFALNPPSPKSFAQFRYAAMIQNGTAPAGSSPTYSLPGPTATMPATGYPYSTGTSNYYPAPTGTMPATHYPYPTATSYGYPSSA